MVGHQTLDLSIGVQIPVPQKESLRKIDHFAFIQDSACRQRFGPKGGFT